MNQTWRSGAGGQQGSSPVLSCPTPRSQRSDSYGNYKRWTRAAAARGVENINKLGGARRPGPRCPWCVRDIHNPGPGSWQILIIGAFSILYTVGHHTSCTVATILQLWAGWMPGLLLICVSLNCLRHQANETSYSLLIRISAAVCAAAACRLAAAPRPEPSPSLKYG